MKKARLHSTLVSLLNDPVLSVVPKQPTLTDVDTFISLELGSAIRISILKLDGSCFDVTVMNSATVKDLKQAVRKRIDDSEQSKMGHRHISWRHVWSNFCLLFHNEKLLDDTAKLQDYGIRNNAQTGVLAFDEMESLVKFHPRLYITPFLHSMDLAYSGADLIVSRAGAMICSEILAAGKPCILIPSPNVAEGHQFHNACLMADVAGSRVITEDELDSLTLKSAIEEILGAIHSLCHLEGLKEAFKEEKTPIFSWPKKKGRTTDRIRG